MHDILLIQGPSTLQKLQRLKMREPEMEAPLPLLYLAPYLLDAGYRVEILDLRIDPLSLLRRYLRERKPLLAGLSVMPGSMLRTAIELTREIKGNSPETRTIWGGTFPSLHYGVCLAVKELDFVGCGDGETTLRELADALRSDKYQSDFRKIKGLAYRHDNEVILTEPRGPTDLECRPVAAWHLVAKYMVRYLGGSRMVTINTARGCPYTCSFCYNTVFSPQVRRYRTKSIPAAMEEVRYLFGRYPVQKILFMDDDFLAHTKRGLALMSAIHDAYPHTLVHIDARADEIKDEQCTAELKRLGLDSVFFGVEGVSAEFLQQIRKGCGSNDALAAAEVCAKWDVTGTYSFTCGYPDENPADLYDRVQMARVIKSIHSRSRCQIEIISPIMGTPLFTELKAKGMIPTLAPSPWAYFSDWKSARNKPWISDARFYEAFQLAFFLAFSSSERADRNLSRLMKMLSRWSGMRLSRPAGALREFRAANFLLKRIIWGLAG